MGDGVYVWAVDVGYPPLVYCIIKADTKDEAEEKAEAYALSAGIDPPEYGDVTEAFEHDFIEGVYRP